MVDWVDIIDVALAAFVGKVGKKMKAGIKFLLTLHCMNRCGMNSNDIIIENHKGDINNVKEIKRTSW